AVLGTVVALILTQSRTAYVGMVVQLILLSVFYGRWFVSSMRARASSIRLAAVGLGVFAVIGGIIFVAWQRGKIDELVFTQAAKSLEYRKQYWQATVQLIRDHAWTGTGPGNFRGHYLRYKLAESSEEIADPHNMVLEVIATSGVVAG